MDKVEKKSKSIKISDQLIKKFAKILLKLKKKKFLKKIFMEINKFNLYKI